MKKLLLTLALATALPVLAQTAPTTPSAPATTAPVVVSPNAQTALANESTNKVFIDQTGSNPTVKILQEGNSNRMGSTNRPVYLYGADQKVDVTQKGNSNQIDLELKNETTGQNVGVTVVIQQVGNSNVIDAACGVGTSGGGASLTGCKAADLNWKFTGNSNQLQFRGTGEDIKSAITVTGNQNSFVIDAVGNKHSQTLMVNGNQNEFNISQTSTGVAGSSTWIDQTGTGAKFNIVQAGTVDNVINIKSVATGGTFNITQKN